MNNHRRYTEASQIEKAIDQCHQKATYYRLRANTLEELSRVFAQCHKLEESKEWKKEAEFLRGKADRLLAVRAVKLSARLAEFMTELLPGVTQDQSVPVKLD